MLARRAIALLIMTVTPLGLGAGCSSSSAKTPATPAAEAGAPGSVAHFALSGDTPPSYLDVPFPSDVYLSGGKIIEPIPGFDKVFTQNSQYATHELAKMDGFSRVALAMFYIDPPAAPPADGGDAGKAKAFSAIDPTSLPTSETACAADGSSVFLIDLAASDPSKARVACRATYHDDTGEPTYAKTRPVLAVGPARGIVLAEAHQYAAVVTSRVKDTAGNNLVASSDFAQVAAGPRTGVVATLYGNAIDKANAALKSALATDGATVVSIAPYTTNDMTQQLFKLRSSIDAQPAPTLAWDAKSVAPMGAVKFAQKVNGALPAGFTDTLDDWLGTATAKLPDGLDDPDANLPVRAHDKVAAIGTAVFQANNYLNYSASGFGALDDGTFTIDGSGNIQPSSAKPKVPIWVSFAVPTAPMPAAGYPIVIVQHGLGESRAEEFMNLANVFANQGWMVAAIDSVTFGARAEESYYQQDTTTNWVGGPGVTYTGPDGLADKVDPTTMKSSPTGSTNGSTDLFGSLLALGAFRDQVRQAEIDTTQLVKVLRSSPNLAPLQTGATVPKIDPSKVGYFGVSLGSLEGEVAAALEPNCKLWVFDVGGGGLLNELASHGPVVGTLLSLAGAVNFGFLNDQFDESHPLIATIQQVADPGDAINFASYLVTSPGTIAGKPVPPRNVLQTSVVYDAWVPNEANEAFARAAGYGLAMPNVGPNAGVNTMALVRAPATNPDPVPLANVMPDGMMLIHDTPAPGITAVLVQTSPSGHGDDQQSSTSSHEYAIPFGQFNSGTPFPMVTTPFKVKTSYLQLQSTTTRFLSDGFAGKVPNVTGFKAPIRDYDGDGYPDATDADPNNPNVH